MLCVMLVGGIAYRAYFGPEPGRIALQIEALETQAPAQKPTSNDQIQTAGLRLGVPGNKTTSEPGANDLAPGDESEEFLIYPDDDEYFAGAEPAYDPGEILITIDGQSQGAQPETLASVTPIPSNISIADPDPELLRATPLGKVPRIAPDGRKAVSYYARPYRDRASNPPVAIIVGGLGLNHSLTERAIDELPPEVSLAFAPYAKDLEFWTRKARSAGHEVLIELPMEGHGPNPQALGAASLLTTRSTSENLQRLDWLMSRFGGYFAVTNYLGAKFSSDQSALTPVLQKLKEAGVGYIDDTGAAESAARTSGVAMISVNRIIPPAPDDSGRNTVRRELSMLEALAKSDGAALAKTYAYAATIDEIADWAARAEQRGISVAPASAILQQRGVHQ